MSSITAGLAGRYATALYQLATEAKQVDEILEDLNSFNELIDNNSDLQTLIYSPVFRADEKAAAVGHLLKKAKANALVIQFVGTIAKNGRLFAISSIISAFIKEVDNRRGKISAEVVSAIPLDNERQAKIQESIISLADAKDVSLVMRVDSSLIGGLVIRIGSRMFDTSLKTKLNRLESAMKGVA
ncbi:MAG: F0F1 ATP synthase subunit delta [Alphaproteobacteria bacterium]